MRTKEDIKSLGKNLFGDRWQTQFAAMTGMSQSYVAMIASGDRPITEQFEAKIRVGLREELKAAKARVAHVAAVIKKHESSG